MDKGEVVFDNKKLYSMIMQKDINLDLTLYSVSWYSPFGRNTVAYTKPSTHRIWLNRKFFTNPRSIAGTLMHEHMHNLGFDHSKYDNDKRKYSIPYQMGRIIEKLDLSQEDDDESKGNL